VRGFSFVRPAGCTANHSIIAVDNPEDPQAEGDDGVVAYSSAHIDGVASEFVVHSGHSAPESPFRDGVYVCDHRPMLVRPA
jgi:hypothetical protein